MSRGRSTTQQDQYNSLRDGKYFDPNVLAKNGELNTSVWDGTPSEAHPWSAQSERVMAAVKTLLDKNVKGGPFRVGLFLDGDVPDRKGSEKWQILQIGMTLGWDWWDDILEADIGLVKYEGALAWPGRGTFEPHLVMFKPERHHKLLEEQQQKKVDALLKPSSLRRAEVGPGLRGESEGTVKTTQHQVPRGELAKTIGAGQD